MLGRVESEEEGDEIGRRKAGVQKVENPERGGCVVERKNLW
jgi:hypothetical protein